jgi:hypothetical protein
MSLYRVINRRRSHVRKSPQSARWGVLTLSLAAACAGCWEEIQYKPTAAPAKIEKIEPPPAVDESPAAAPAAESSASSTPSTGTVESTTTPALEASTSAEPPIPKPTADVKTATARELLLVWRAASKWSLAAGAYGKGLEAPRYEPLLEEANAAAAELGLELPGLPTTDDDVAREVTVVDSLRTGPGNQLASAVDERFGSQAGALARLAIGSHLLLLVYSPQDPDAASHAVAVREAAGLAGLPTELWEPLAALLESQAEYLDVRGAVFELHRQVEGHLGRL